MRFVGVDPSAEMLGLASEIVEPHASRIELQQGRIDDVHPGPFDGATCLLTLHVLDRDERLRTLRALRRFRERAHGRLGGHGLGPSSRGGFRVAH